MSGILFGLGAVLLFAGLGNLGAGRLRGGDLNAWRTRRGFVFPPQIVCLITTVLGLGVVVAALIVLVL